MDLTRRYHLAFLTGETQRGKKKGGKRCATRTGTERRLARSQTQAPSDKKRPRRPRGTVFDDARGDPPGRYNSSQLAYTDSVCVTIDRSDRQNLRNRWKQTKKHSRTEDVNDMINKRDLTDKSLSPVLNDRPQSHVKSTC